MDPNLDKHVVTNRNIDRIAYSVTEAARITGLGRTTLFALIRDERLPSCKIGNRRLIRRVDLEALFMPQDHATGR